MWPDRMDGRRGGSFINGCQFRRIGYLSLSPPSFQRSPDKAGAVKIRKGDIKSVAQGLFFGPLFLSLLEDQSFFPFGKSRHSYAERTITKARGGVVTWVG